MNSGMSATVCDWPAWQGATSEMYLAIHERVATPPGRPIARSLRVDRVPGRDCVARLVHSTRYGTSARALSRPGARSTRFIPEFISGSWVLC